MHVSLPICAVGHCADGFLGFSEVSLRIVGFSPGFLRTLADDTPCRNSQIQRGAHKVCDPLTRKQGRAHVQ